MIQQLIQLIINQLVAGLAGVIPTPASRITQGPVTPPLAAARPHIALQADALNWAQAAKDDTSGKPRNLSGRERIPVNVGTPAGPYALANQPLDGSVEVRVVYEEGLVDEYDEELLPGTDFTVNVPGSEVTILKTIDDASALRVTYTFIGNATVREFTQVLNLTVYLNGWSELNRVTGLTTAIVQSQQALLLEQFNFQTPTTYSANGFFCSVLLSKVNLVSMTMPPESSSGNIDDIQVVLSYHVVGTEQMGQSLSGGFGLLESIRSRDASGPGVNITPNIG